MPTYVYRCSEEGCGLVREGIRSIKDRRLAPHLCPRGHLGKMELAPSAVPFYFEGSFSGGTTQKHRRHKGDYATPTEVKQVASSKRRELDRKATADRHEAIERTLGEAGIT